MSGHHRESDRKAAFTGVIVGAIFVIVVIVVISKLTTRKFAGHEEKATASAMR